MTLPGWTIDGATNDAYRQGAANAHATLAGAFDRMAHAGNPWAAQAAAFIREQHDREFLGIRSRVAPQRCAVDYGGGPCWCGPIGCARILTRP